MCVPTYKTCPCVPVIKPLLYLDTDSCAIYTKSRGSNSVILQLFRLMLRPKLASRFFIFFFIPKPGVCLLFFPVHLHPGRLQFPANYEKKKKQTKKRMFACDKENKCCPAVIRGVIELTTWRSLIWRVSPGVVEERRASRLMVEGDAPGGHQ